MICPLKPPIKKNQENHLLFRKSPILIPLKSARSTVKSLAFLLLPVDHSSAPGIQGYHLSLGVQNQGMLPADGRMQGGDGIAWELAQLVILLAVEQGLWVNGRPLIDVKGSHQMVLLYPCFFNCINSKFERMDLLYVYHHFWLATLKLIVYQMVFELATPNLFVYQRVSSCFPFKMWKCMGIHRFRHIQNGAPKTKPQTQPHYTIGMEPVWKGRWDRSIARCHAENTQEIDASRYSQQPNISLQASKNTYQKKADDGGNSGNPLAFSPQSPLLLPT